MANHVATARLSSSTSPTESFELLLLQHQSQLGVYAKSKECQPGVDPYSRLKYQLFLRLPEATNVHHYIKHATFSILRVRVSGTEISPRMSSRAPSSGSHIPSLQAYRPGSPPAYLRGSCSESNRIHEQSSDSTNQLNGIISNVMSFIGQEQLHGLQGPSIGC